VAIKTLAVALLFGLAPFSIEPLPIGESPMNQPPERSDPADSPDTSGQTVPDLIFATYAESDEDLRYALHLAESIRQFAGRFSDAPIWLYIPEGFTPADTALLNGLTALAVEIRTSSAPDESRRFYYAGKTFAAGVAETDAESRTRFLVWMDIDTIVLLEPGDFLLPDKVAFAYRPVMHNRSGTLYGQPPNEFWRRIYDKLNIDDSLLFPMITPADRQKINTYFNAGLLVVRPERGILRGWGESFKILYEDSMLARMCDENIENKIFLHQTALVGPVLHRIGRDEMVELSARYNYPIFFHQQYEAATEFESIGDVVTLRYDVYFRDPDPEWATKLKGDPDKIAWLKARLGRQ